MHIIIIVSEEPACATPQATGNPSTEPEAAELRIDLNRAPADGKVPQVAPAPAPLSPDHVSVSTFPAQGGGWSLNNAGIMLTHTPTGIQAACCEHRSAHANKAEAWKRLEAAVAEYENSVGALVKKAEQRLGDAVGEFLLFKVAPEGWGSGWQAGPSFGIELKEWELRLRDDQFAYVDPVAGTMSGEDINNPDSRVYAELVKRGWTPPGEIAYPPHRKAQPGDGSADTCYRNGWNECRIATMHLNQRNSNRVGR